MKLEDFGIVHIANIDKDNRWVTFPFPFDFEEKKAFMVVMTQSKYKRFCEILSKITEIEILTLKARENIE